MQSEKLKTHIFETYNYNQFSQLEGNRIINKLHVDRLKRSFKKKYLLSPINVNNKFEIIDGQHRFNAAKELKLPIYYYISDNSKLEDVHILNTNMKNWRKEDYLNAYCEIGNQNYIQFKEFMDEFPDFGINSCQAILSNTTNTHSMVNSNFKSFQEGGFLIKNYNNAVEMANNIMMVKPYYEGYYRLTFVRAMIGVMKVKEYNHSKFIQKLSKQNGLMKNCLNVGQYKLMIEEIYNRHSRNPISLRF